LKELIQVAEIDYVARAPEGYEVEELTRKQMIKALQNKKQISEGKIPEEIEVETPEASGEEYTDKEKVLLRFLKKLKVKNKEQIVEAVRTIGLGQAIAFDKKMNQLFEISVGKLYDKLDEFHQSKYLVMDGILTSRLLSRLLKFNVDFVACKNREEELKIPDKITVFYF
jgi:DNA primase